MVNVRRDEGLRGFGREPANERATDAAAGTRDDDDPSGQLHRSLTLIILRGRGRLSREGRSGSGKNFLWKTQGGCFS
jgi:hypothetical protein